MTEAREPQIEILTRPRIRRPPKPLSPVPDLFKPSIFKASSGPYAASTLVNLAKLEVVSLMRYRRMFQLGEVGPAAARDELLHAVSRHFAEQAVEEVQVLRDFRSALQRRHRKQQLMQQQYPTHFAHLHETGHRPAAVRPLFLGPRMQPLAKEQQQQGQQQPRGLVLDQAVTGAFIRQPLSRQY
ncbi:hypothetical protein COO60DRAFT_939212 [Scenedesmus sp. NREL 46B-D3]|nr:hypothetical protein COO60DRAFT_939212 [Scenedesmus sp. NREL 46B-D3]